MYFLRDADTPIAALPPLIEGPLNSIDTQLKNQHTSVMNLPK